jgi:protein TonB
MQDVLLAEGGGRYGAAPRRRSLSFVLALAMSLLLLAALLSVGLYEPPVRHEGGTLTAVNLSAAAGDKSDNPTPRPQKAEQKATRAAAAPPAATMPPRVVVPTDNKVVWPEGFIPMKRSDFAATDISRMRSPAGTGSAAQVASAGGGGGGASGTAPDGSRLYNAEWYREPAEAALTGYLRPGQSTGRWAEIACRTIADYHVDNCQELDESPRGSGMARVLRQAAWQFLVRPPRLNGKSMVGEWVRIRYTFTTRKRDDDAGSSGDAGNGDG